MGDNWVVWMMVVGLFVNIEVDINAKIVDSMYGNYSVHGWIRSNMMTIFLDVILN